MTQHLCLKLSALREVSRLTPAALDSLAEAAAVMLDRYHEVPPPPTPFDLRVQGEEMTAEVDWHGPTDQQHGTHANEKDAAEDGACAVAIATVGAIGYTVLRRTRHGSGCDYLMVRAGEPENDFRKLEVSGTAEGDLEQRLRRKVTQARGGDLDRSGLAVVVGFKAAKILVEGWS